MAPRQSQGRASFFWQGLFILLPVAIMAGIALMALVRDRAAAEREARQRAEELLQQVSNGFDRAMGFQLSQLGSGVGGWYGQLWTQEHLTEAALWPGSLERHKAEQERQAVAQAHAETEAAFEELTRASGLRPEDIVMPGLTFTPEGELSPPSEQAREAQPPSWRLELTAKQLEALNALDELDPSTTNAEPVNAALKRFLDTDPPEPARADAEFMRLRLLLAGEPAASAVRQWLEFARNYAVEFRELRHGALYIRGNQTRTFSWEAVSESGLPVSSLAVAKALQRARESGLTEALWRAVAREVEDVPSSFTPTVLELVEPLTQGRPELQSCLQALKLRWQATERAWDAAEAIRCSGRLQGLTTTNFWLEFQGSRWLCLLQPGQTWTGSGPATVTNWFTQARLFPKPAVEEALRQVVHDSRVSLPAYLRLSAEVEGEPLSGALDTELLQAAPGQSSVRSALSIESAPEEGQAPSGAAWTTQPVSGNHMPLLTELNTDVLGSRPYRHGAPNGAYAALAQTEGRLTCPATLANGADPTPQSVEFESMPGRPHFVLRIELADRALLFAAQRRRTWMFGSLVLAAALTAAVGFGAAYRSFHRQLRLSEMKSNFVSSVSHELRAPIASVRLMAESLERGKIVEAPKQQEYFRFIGQECRRLSSLIENVLDFSRIEQGRKQYEFEPTDLVELVRQTVQLMDTYAAERGVKLALSVPSSQLSTINYQLLLDGKAIQQALINLIDNALKHSPKGETVTVGLDANTKHQAASTKLQAPSSRETSNTKHQAPEKHQAPSSKLQGGPPDDAPSTLHQAPGTMSLWVEDHGPGIPASEHERIFERFYRLGSELRRDTQGVGIGLSIVKHVVEAHRGRVRVRSAPGQGSRFTIELPLQ